MTPAAHLMVSSTNSEVLIATAPPVRPGRTHLFGRSMRVSWWLALAVGLVAWSFAGTSCAEGLGESRPLNSGDWWRVLSLRDYNTRVVVIGTGLLGFSAGIVGSFALLRKRALMGDALSHATLPGIGAAFLLVTYWGGDGKSLMVLLTGAAISGVLGTLAIIGIVRLPRLKEDAALGIVLSVFFGAGIAILVLVQQLSTGHAAGLESFIYGKTASMLQQDAVLIGGAGLAVSLLAMMMFKELKLLCFDESFCRSQGYSRGVLDLALMGMIVVVTIIGLQAVGLILMIALMVTPPAAARFWTEQMESMTWIAALIGTLAAVVGSAASALFPQLPSGATIVLACSFCFMISMLFGTARGTIQRFWRRHVLKRRIGRQHLLRALFEQGEMVPPKTGPAQDRCPPVPVADILDMRSWNRRQLQREIRRAEREGEVVLLPNDTIKLTPTGLVAARKMAHEHRLWEIYLITHAEIAPSKVDRDADMIEHILQPSMIAELERVLEQQMQPGAFPASPHPLGLNESSSSTQADELGSRSSEGGRS